MSQISKCPKITVVLGYWEALGEVSELSYKSLLYSTSVGSYCIHIVPPNPRGGDNTEKYCPRPEDLIDFGKAFSIFSDPY